MRSRRLGRSTLIYRGCLCPCGPTVPPVRGSTLAPLRSFRTLQFPPGEHRNERITYSRLLHTDGHAQVPSNGNRTGIVGINGALPLPLTASGQSAESAFQGSTPSGARALSVQADHHLSSKPHDQYERRLVIRPVDHHKVSAVTASKVGATELLAVPSYLDFPEILPHSIGPDVVVKQLGAFVRASHDTGLVCCLSAASHLREQFPALATLHVSHRGSVVFSVPWSGGHDTSTFCLDLCPRPAWTSYPVVRIRNVNLPAMPVAIRGDADAPTAVKCTLLIDCRSSGNDKSGGHEAAVAQQHPLREDVSRVADTAHIVANRLCQDMTLNQRESIPAYLSEAILRTLRTVFLAGECDSVDMLSKFPGSAHPSVRALTTWRDAAPAVEDPTILSAAEPTKSDWCTQSGIPTYGPVAFYDDLASRERGYLQGGPTRGVLLQENKGITVVGQPLIRSPSFSSKTGLDFYGYSVSWSPQNVLEALPCDPRRLEDMIETHANTTLRRGFTCLRSIAEYLETSIPGPVTFRITGRHHLSGTRSLSSPTLSLKNGSLEVQASRGDGPHGSPATVCFNVTLPRIAGFAMLDDLRYGFVGISLRGHLAQQCSQDLGANVPESALKTIEAVAGVVGPILKAAESAAMNDTLALRIASALIKARVLFPGEIHGDLVEITLGDTQDRKITGRATTHLTDDTEVDPEIASPSLPDSNVADSEELEDDLSDERLAEARPRESDAENAHTVYQDPTKDIEESKASSSNGFGPAVTANGITAHSSNIKSQALSSKTGLQRFSFTIDWPTNDLAAISPLSLADIEKIILGKLEAGCGGGLRYLSGVTNAVRLVLPLEPTLKIYYNLWKNESASTRQARTMVGFVVAVATKPEISSTPPGNADLSTRIVLPTLSDMRWSSGETGRDCWVAIKVDGRLSDNASVREDIDHTDIIMYISAATRNILQPILAEADSSIPPDALAAKAAEALGQATTIFPSSLTVDCILVQIGEGRKGVQSRVIGQATQAAARPGARGVHTTSSPGEVFVALGSNVGDRVEAIEAACRAIDEEEDVRILRTSPLYETEPMYVEDQQRFLNGACEIDTTLQPMELLDRLQAIEQQLGRVKNVDKGPRNIDLDILTYKNEIVKTERLTIPHALMTEREFVLRPLTDIHNKNQLGPLRGSASTWLKRVQSKPLGMFPQTPLGPDSAIIRAMDPKRSTRVMSILNVTPDSFSDGGTNEPADHEALKATVASHIAAGATIIDIGGQSSRPNAPDITAKEEIARVLPAIEAIKSLPEAEHVAISVDTYRGPVAAAAIEAGAHIINDISAGLLDANMLPTIAKLGCTYVMMHMRGTPATMQDPENLSYPDGLIPTIAAELRARLDAAQEAGIRRWRIILDPGIGFAKTQEQNTEVLRKLPELVHTPSLRNMPWLIGSSRKGFIGKITGVQEPNERVWGTAATVTAAVQGGADLVRVHDVREMAQVAKMADAMYRV